MRKVIFGLGLTLAACGGGGGGNQDAGGDDTPDAMIGTGTPTAFRFTDMDLRDPHIFVQIASCDDYTDGGLFVVNDEIQDAIQADGDDPPDGLLDLSPTIVFRPLDQTSATNGMQLYFADCTAPLAGTSCVPGSAAPVVASATNMSSGSCLTPVPGSTTDMYSPDVATPSGPCFVSDGQDVMVDIAGIPIMLRDAQVAAAYGGSPATSLTSGVMIGFLTEADANAAMLPDDLPLIGGSPFASVLPGGDGNCAAHDDKDNHEGQDGWWFYLNFTAQSVPWTDP